MKTRKRVRLWHIAVAIPVVCGLSGWIVSEVTTRGARARMREEIAALKALGAAVTPADMSKPIDVQSNAAPLYRLAIEALKRAGKDPPTRSGSSINAPPDPVFEQALSAWISKHDETLDILRRAAEKPNCDFNRRWADGYKVLFPELALMKQFTRMVAYKARQAEESGDFTTATAWLNTGFRIARHTREPTMIGQLVAIACESIVLAELQREITVRGTNPEFQVQARKLLESIGDLPSMQDAMSGEVLAVIVTHEQLERGEITFRELGMLTVADSDFADHTVEYAMRFAAVRANVATRVLSWQRELLNNLEQVKGDMLKTAEACEVIDQKIAADQSLYGTIASVYAPVYGQAGMSVLGLEARRRLTRCGLELWANSSRGFPSSLTGTNQWEIDPLTDKPFVYRREGAGFRLYSVGPNLTDNGGKPSSSGGPSDDFEFRARSSF